MKVGHLPSTLGLTSAELGWLRPTKHPAPSAKRRSSPARHPLKPRPGIDLSWTHSALSFQLLQTAFALHNFLQTNLLLCGDPCNDFFQAACPLSSSFEETLARILSFVHWFDVVLAQATSKAFNRAFESAFPSPKADTAASNLRTSVASAATTSGARLGGRGGDNYPVEWGWIFSFAAGHCSDLGLGPLRTLTHPDGTSNCYPRVGMTCPQIGTQKRDTKRTKTRSTHAG